MRSMRNGRLALLSGLLACAAVVGSSGALAVHGGDREVTVGSNDAVFSQNKQNEPAIAVDASRPNVLAAGANDNIDMEACNAGNPKSCPFTDGVGVTGVQFSFDGGDSWIQPEYTGWTARHCVGPPGFTCTPGVGPIGTLPWYYEEGLVADGDPAVAFGPRPGPGGFSWAHGSRLYFANLTSNFSAERDEAAFKGFEAIAVSRTDDVVSAAANNKNAWMRPVIVSKQSSATFADKEQIWADNASSSRFFGNVYVCWTDFRGAGAAPVRVARSTDGGDTWEVKQVSPAHNVAPKLWGHSGCTIRTSSTGTVYVFYELFQDPSRFLPPVGTHMMVRSFDGGRSWERPRALFRVTDPCFYLDPVINRCMMDGIGGSRNDLAAAPSVDIANGAPSGAGATNLIVDTWADGRDGLNNEDVMISHSSTGGASWSEPRRISNAPDRGFYAAPALSPDGTDVYIVYNAFTTPFRNNTTDPRTLVGVVKHANVAGTPGAFAEIHRGAPGDSRGSAQNNLQAGFLGDYVYAIATRDYAAAVWNDARAAAVCGKMNTYLQMLRDGTATTSETDPNRPAPNVECPPAFGNTDIFGGSWRDPTP